MHEGGGRWVGSNKLVELKKKKKGECIIGTLNNSNEPQKQTDLKKADT